MLMHGKFVFILKFKICKWVRNLDLQSTLVSYVKWKAETGEFIGAGVNDH